MEIQKVRSAASSSGSRMKSDADFTGEELIQALLANYTKDGDENAKTAKEWTPIFGYPYRTTCDIIRGFIKDGTMVRVGVVRESLDGVMCRKVAFALSPAALKKHKPNRA